MGLDMYAYAVAPEKVPSQVDFEVARSEETEELFYWRKHHDLHGWMEKLYRAKGGKAEDFNLVNVVLTLEDLDRLEKAVKEEGAVLPVTRGFFFGNYPPNAETQVRDLEFIAKAREAIHQGKAVYYTSWW